MTLRTSRPRYRDLQGSTGIYRDLVDLCHRYGISTHFSNILGFPDQDEEAILHHVRQLRAIRPFMASFYILTPIPGTDQYDDFLAGGLIRETNLDRFDATCSVWRHPRIESERLETHLYLAYREFYSARDVLTKMFRHRWNASYFVHALGVGYAAFARFAANRGMHPMAGGFGRVRIDTAADYLRFRRRVFGIDQLSLPASLSLSQATFIEAARATIPPSAAASQRWLLG